MAISLILLYHQWFHSGHFNEKMSKVSENMKCNYQKVFIPSAEVNAKIIDKAGNGCSHYLMTDENGNIIEASLSVYKDCVIEEYIDLKKSYSVNSMK